MANVFVCGGRKFEDYFLLERYLDHCLRDLKQRERITIIHGGAWGADHLAKCYAINNELDQVVIHPDYEKHPKKVAPLIRNTQLVEMADYCVAFWDGKSGGTKDAFTKAEKKGIPVKILRYDQW